MANVDLQKRQPTRDLSAVAVMLLHSSAVGALGM